LLYDAPFSHDTYNTDDKDGSNTVA